MIILSVYSTYTTPPLPQTIGFEEKPFGPNEIEAFVRDCSDNPAVYDVQMTATYTMGAQGPRTLSVLSPGKRTGLALWKFLNEDTITDTGRDVHHFPES